MNYRKKPIIVVPPVVEAMQFRHDGNGNEILQWAGCWYGSTSDAVTFGGDETGRTLTVKNPEGVMVANDGDWIIKVSASLTFSRRLTNK